MNTSRKGAAYENAYRRLLEASGATVLRSAASHGPFDLVVLWAYHTELVQLKAYGTCSAAQRLADGLRRYDVLRRYVLVVHRTPTEEYCVHCPS